MYGEIIIGLLVFAGGCRACKVPLPITGAQQWFHHARSVTVLLHTLILQLLNLLILNSYRFKIQEKYDCFVIFVTCFLAVAWRF